MSNFLNLPWNIFKNIVDSKKLSIQYIILNNIYWLEAFDGLFKISCSIVITNPASQEQNEFELSYKNNGNQQLTLLTPDKRPINAINRIASGYTVYPTGISDNILTGSYGTGIELKLIGTDSSTKTKDFQLLDHYYGIGGRLIWENACLDDYIEAFLIAPATIGLTNSTGDFNKYSLGGGLNMIIPASPGTGLWTMDLTAKRTNTQILKAVPVPAVGNNGYFDYNSDTNIITPNYNAQGGYNLFDFDIKLFAFCRKVWGRKQDGSESTIEVTDVIGKLLYNSWIIRFNLVTSNPLCKAGIIMTTAVKGNV